MGAPYTTCIAMARAPITATMKAKYMGELMANKSVNPAILSSLGFPKEKEPDPLTLSEAFVEYDPLKRKYEANVLSPAAIGLYTYFTSKLGTGIKQLLAGVRKFNINLIDRQDIACISNRAMEVCRHWGLGIEAQEALDLELVKKEIYSGNY
jgi:hypothetical protein